MADARVHSNESRMERGGAFIASLLFHVLLLLVLGSTTSFDITLGDQSRFDVIFWISPSSAAPQGAPDLPPPNTAPAPAHQVAEAAKPTAAVVATKTTGFRPGAAAPRLATRNIHVETRASLPPAGLAIVETPADATLLPPPTAKPAPASPALQEGRASATSGQRLEMTKKQVVERHEPEQVPATLPVPVRFGSFMPDRFTREPDASGSYDSTTANSAGDKRADATATGNPSAAAERGEEPTPAAAGSKPAEAVVRGEESPRRAARALSAGTVSHLVPSSPVKNQPLAEKAPEPRGIVAASLQGDLKLIISGDSDIRLLVTFREYPKSRRDRPLTRSEARREQRIQPLLARKNQETREAVVETARDGIYIFRVEPGNGDKAKATFTLKVFETGRREKTAEIGTRTISGKTVLARVLMRDGVLWDDESAFTGAFDDSESTTKYNANTGLYWKEYHH